LQYREEHIQDVNKKSSYKAINVALKNENNFLQRNSVLSSGIMNMHNTEGMLQGQNFSKQ
jgi:hypothetical protein